MRTCRTSTERGGRTDTRPSPRWTHPTRRSSMTAGAETRAPDAAAALSHVSATQGDAARPFADRHIGPRSQQTQEMLAELGYDSLEALAAEAVPANIAQADPLTYAPTGERETLARLRELAAKNTMRVQMIGQGYHDTITPAENP